MNYLYMLNNPQLNAIPFFEVMRDFRKGGLNPKMYDEFILMVKSLPPINKRTESDFKKFKRFNLTPVNEEEYSIIMREVLKRANENTQKCWHPEADDLTCSTNNKGKVIISGAHSIQNNGILNRISENGHVTGYSFESPGFNGKEYGRSIASVFYGFCNKHDSIFYPIEVEEYNNTQEQNFLFAYRGFIVSSHKKEVTKYWVNYGEQSDIDFIENKKFFDQAINTKNYDIIETQYIEMPAFYPIAVSSSFYLDYDFNGNEINHSHDRMEYIYVTLLPTEKKTFFLLSYLKQDIGLYGHLIDQLKARNNIRSDISMLLAAHTENIYFNPTYYKTFIQQFDKDLEEIMIQAQFDTATIDDNDNIKETYSFTQKNYLNNPWGISFFGY